MVHANKHYGQVRLLRLISGLEPQALPRQVPYKQPLVQLCFSQLGVRSTL